MKQRIKPSKDQTAVSVCSVIFSTSVPSMLHILHLAWSMHFFVSSSIKLKTQEVIRVFQCCCFNRRCAATSVWALNLQKHLYLLSKHNDDCCKIKWHRVRSACKLNSFIRWSNVSSHKSKRQVSSFLSAPPTSYDVSLSAGLLKNY